ncbi:MAG: hypothetical protein M3O01_05175 [Pseudomonadota bacterium]|nr:hypothetical protein [Pseudomonadota bacterium]
MPVSWESTDLGPFAAVWHLLNLFAPAVGIGLVSAALAKLLWRADLKPVGWLRLAGWAASVSALVLVAGLVAWGRDGKIATYAAMVLACAFTLWWVGFGRRR